MAPDGRLSVRQSGASALWGHGGPPGSIFVVQGIRFLRPSLFITNPSTGVNPNVTGGFLDPLLGTLLVTVMAMIVALPVGIALAVWLSEYGRRPWPAWPSRRS